MTTQPIIKLNLGQVASVYGDRLVAFFQSGIKPEEALAKVLEALAKEIAEQRELTQEALAEAAKYVHPKTAAGIIKDKRDRLARYNQEGEKDAAELAALQAKAAAGALGKAEKTRMLEVNDELVKDSANVTATQTSLTGDEANYKRWNERYQERLKKLEGMREQFTALQTEGPSLIAQIKDSQRADAARAADEKSKLGVGTAQSATTMLQNLRGQAAEASLKEEAGDLLDETLKGEPSLDEELAARDAQNAQNDTVAGWMAKAKGG